jgi:hypothetical protein
MLTLNLILQFVGVPSLAVSHHKLLRNAISRRLEEPHLLSPLSQCMTVGVS